VRFWVGFFWEVIFTKFEAGPGGFAGFRGSSQQ
jgi:hypothetical protein